MAGRSLARSATAITERARAQFQQDQIDLIRHTLMPEGSNDGELAMFLEVAARYELDPFTGQIWPVKYKGKVRNVVAKDGWLALADRRPDFRGVSSDVVRKHDHFQKKMVAGKVEVDHTYRDEKGEPTHGGEDGELRGPIIGAWAVCSREGHNDTYFFAYWKRYNKGERTWATHPDAMMQKVAEAMALRKAYPLSGLYSEFEVEPDRAPTNLSAPGGPLPIDFGEDEELAGELEQAFHALGYTRAKVRTIMRGCKDRDDRVKVLAGLKAEADTIDLPDEAVHEEPAAA